MGGYNRPIEYRYCTLPLLEYLIDGGYAGKNKKVAKKLPFEASLSNRTIAILFNVTDLDQKIYDRVKSDYVLADMFPEIKR